ncbi:MAG: single-stranded-DNA-specific exonuclease RecJ [Cytophagales bacterium]|uniref:single-stranded-DNA-specific exonuclease RecJ n=1 Tax=Cyclobacterium marinum TaxID=104 RepID=UPI0011EF7B4F|nr:single-stranded-DNA-specific exonuclease RecJ [Cyclobacterium marinum]MBI0401669.1 single-stranded-DNA-specific exonuclease RecJ [Cyclobacterium marinum]MBR9775976.1 single-stranded-DNA-specific exonuclease RecJ [Cytophagales bacterium]|tara:strand:- start:26399 stop:28099 length:1701 start_codon:yes stop_codon:yes gene_type:complete
MDYRWKHKDKANSELVEHLSNEINVNPTLANVLVNRGISDFQQAKDFFRPDLDKLHDPYLMKDMDVAVQRLHQAIEKNEKILVYGDYDVDGTTSVALFYGFIQSFYSNVAFYIPDRYKEGYGISEKGVRFAAENNFSLVVSLDCGIKALDKIDLANELGVDFIICDHHTPGETLPRAIAVLDPKRKDCSYPFKELSGCGVGFKLIQAFSQFTGRNQNNLYAFLDLLVISIASDIVPISGENRILAYFGLERLNNNPRPGIKALILKGKLEKDINITDIVFKIGPRINASGRLEHAKASVELLISKDLDEAVRRAELVEDVNAARKNFDENITREALEMIETRELEGEFKSTVLFKEDWHKGVIGIVASRCIEKYYRPTIILTESNNKATGSARSVYDFNIYEAIEECSDLLEQFGGHKYAAGLTLSVANVPAFQAKFESVVSNRVSEIHMKPILEIDDELILDQINYRFYNILKQMTPFGPGNPEPVFCANQVFAENVRVLKDKHLRFDIIQDGQSTKPVCIGFGFADYFDLLNSKMRFNIAFEIRENTFRNTSSLQLYVKDIKFD